MLSLETQNLALPVRHDRYPAIDPRTTLKDTAAGKVVFIAGASRGIGQATAVAFAEAGARARCPWHPELINRYSTSNPNKTSERTGDRQRAPAGRLPLAYARG